MNLNDLKDKDLLTQMRQLIQSERNLLVSILHHLRELSPWAQGRKTVLCRII
jgi:hypothetical protein